ncbi:hypothetical protein OROGR_003487 [Orobanche gracilis]
MGILLSVIRYLVSLTDDDYEESPKNPLFFPAVPEFSNAGEKSGNDILECSQPSLAHTSVRDGNVKSSAVSTDETKAAKGIRRRIRHYSNRQRILLVGEGDFSFSTCLARAFGLAPNMVATSLNSEGPAAIVVRNLQTILSEDFLVKNYENALPNIVELGIRKCKVMHEIDATVMANHEFLGGIKFDRVIFNFPFAGFFNNLSRDSLLRRHRRLVSLFLKNAKEMLSENGEIHISHKTNGVHAEWKLESVASSHGLMLIEAVDFKLHHYPGYNTKRGFGGDDNFNCYPSKTYKFGLKRVITVSELG